jgi:hypothetical protein
MATPSDRATPLGAYLTREGISNNDFAARLSGIDGRPIDPAVVSMWRNALRVPGFANRRLIAAATSGRVPAEAWDAIRPRKPNKRKAPRRAPRPKLRRAS